MSRAIELFHTKAQVGSSSNKALSGDLVKRYELLVGIREGLDGEYSAARLGTAIFEAVEENPDASFDEAMLSVEAHYAALKNSIHKRPSVAVPAENHDLSWFAENTLKATADNTQKVWDQIDGKIVEREITVEELDLIDDAPESELTIEGLRSLGLVDASHDTTSGFNPEVKAKPKKKAGIFVQEMGQNTWLCPSCRGNKHYFDTSVDAICLSCGEKFRIDLVED